MGQAGSAQREPSMEEILASIRKIIEETEHAREDAPAIETPQAQAEGPADEMPEPEAAAPREADISAFRQAIAGIGDDSGPAAQDRPGDTGGSLTLAEVQRRLVRDGQDDSASSAPETAGSSVDFDFVDDMIPALADDDESGMPGNSGQPANGGTDVAAATGHGGGEPGAPDEMVGRTAATDPHPAQTSRPALLSPDVGRQVAGSFDELKEAFMASRQKSFDEMAQEMLRPMLQDWLDNNLPVLVERLVREEIERIARG